MVKDKNTLVSFIAFNLSKSLQSKQGNYYNYSTDEDYGI